MSTELMLQRSGIRLGNRLEKAVSTGFEHTFDATDTQLEFFTDRLLGRQRGWGQFSKLLTKIHSQWDALSVLSELELDLRWSQCDSGTARCACIAEIVLRETGLKAHDEQLYAAWLVRNAHCIEMYTGEGKSLVAVIAAVWVASEGVATHVVTTNEYLVQRDAARYSSVYQRANLTVGSVRADQDENERRAGYAHDVVYVTGKQIGFDYLRDSLAGHNGRGRLKNALHQLMPVADKAPIQRGLEFAIVDELDNVLIDDARTPLVLASAESSKASPEQHAEAGIALGLAAMMQASIDYIVSDDMQSVSITNEGRKNLQVLVEAISGAWSFARFRNEKVRQALHVMHVLQLDKDYIVRGDSVELIDQSTGRTMPDRHLSHGMQQMLEAHTGRSMSGLSTTELSITFRGLFVRYRHLSGMTGTLKGLESELYRSYKLRARKVPHSISNQLDQLPMLLFVSHAEQIRYLVDNVKRRAARGQPVLVGVRTVEESETLSTILSAYEIKHRLINAKSEAEESDIVAQAGQPGAITIATHMAGRGTDIPLGNSVSAAGGLHVISLSVNESRRIERQLFGRSARQGNPGSCQALISLEDPLIKEGFPLLITQCYKHFLAKFPRTGRLVGQAMVKGLMRRIEARHRAQRDRTYQQNQTIESRLAFGIHGGHQP